MDAAVALLEDSKGMKMTKTKAIERAIQVHDVRRANRAFNIALRERRTKGVKFAGVKGAASLNRYRTNIMRLVGYAA